MYFFNQRARGATDGEEELFFYWNESASNFHFEMSYNLEVPIIGVNIRPALGHLFNGETLDIITGISTGGLYHLQTNSCIFLLGDMLMGDMNGDEIYNILYHLIVFSSLYKPFTRAFTSTYVKI